MDINTSRKYNSTFRKKLVGKFEKIKSKSELLDIYNIIIEDIGTDFSTNQNGIFINMNILSDKCIKKLIDYIEDKSITSTTQTETEKINYKTYKLGDVEDMSEGNIKLSNQEKNIIKRIREKI